MTQDHTNIKKIAIVALGGSFADYVMARINSERFDEVWGINCIGAVFHVDRTFMMDPASRFLDDIKAGTQTGVAQEFLLETPNKGPIYSCIEDERVPEIELFPLQQVISATGFSYFNNTVAYAVAYAIATGVEEICLYGIDYSYKENIHVAEAGRGCVEFWCGIAAARGIKIQVAPRSPLLDTNVPDDEKLYGYHRLDDPLVQKIEDGSLMITKASMLTPPEPVDNGPVLIGRDDVEGVSYTKENKDD